MAGATVTTAAVDTAPEFCHYEDTGCEVWSSCLECPLPQCRFDDPTWYHQYKRLAKDARMCKIIYSEGLTAEQAAKRFSVTVRTVFRIMQRCREASYGMDLEALPALVAD